jgi:UDP:flavonoid glycosyltransferase YjiC (YdhE family)
MPSIERRVYAHYADPFNAVRRAYGLPELADLRDCMCSENFNLVADIEEFFPHTQDMPPTFEYVGPILWKCDSPAPDWLAKLDRNRRTVYLTMGSTGPLEKIPEIARRLAAEGLQVICTTGTEQTRPEDEHIHSIQFAPGKALCEAADVVVCHAGNGTIYQALSCGKPIIGVPEFHDQDFNMQRVEALGLGLRVDPSRLLKELVPQVRKVLDGPGFAERASEWKGKYGDLNGAVRAAEWIQKVACPDAIRRGASAPASSG